LTGIRKPDPAIFLYALMQLKLRPTQAVHVGDSEKHDVEGGSIAGLRTVLISRGLNQEKTLADYRFRSLTEASETLQSL
jgi:putative hydrolase of the HAD superfamily